MPIDPTAAVGAALPAREATWTSSDVLLYHLALGAGGDPVSPGELRYAYESDLHVLPTFAVVAPSLRETAPPSLDLPGIDIDLRKVLHGGQEVVLHRPLPTDAKAVAQTTIADVYDKGKAAVIVQETALTSQDGEPLATMRSQVFVRGEGGFGGDRGPSDRVELPDRAPDAELLTHTLPQQALWYRLCGDRNPLHVDPGFAAAAGFDRPILHGLCTYGMVCKAVVDGVLDGDVAAVAGFRVRFAGVVIPGETLRTRVWREDGQLLLTTGVVERDDAPALADGVLTVAG
ncbi:MAG: MaoC/PaaZ C-terminal domain-containing protein [Micromonosporaceae bacterium]